MLYIVKHAADHEEFIKSLLEFYCYVDAFCHAFLPHRDRQSRAHANACAIGQDKLVQSEVMMIPDSLLLGMLSWFQDILSRVCLGSFASRAQTLSATRA